ncbi:nucleoid-associated protein [uncultured Cohaesibacter sp.]|uniref:nucleoid-associated protein n=1 Tax=uncultured Cohaesibacter sp. TaxID=1002546 RepID=UPI002AAAAF43|nr:nucleoid-associated protein [uncultured Cohaesibacter sp.]
MTNALLNAAIHNLTKSEEGNYSIEYGPTDLANVEIAQMVTDHIFKLYNRRTSKSFGRFSEDEDAYPSVKYFGDYLDAGVDGFEALTKALVGRLKTEAQKRPASEGGFVFFAHFIRENKQYFIVTILNNRWGAAVRDNLYPEPLDHLDIDGFRFAGRVNMTSWQEGGDRYISFLKGKGNVAVYFEEFLGCNNVAIAKEDTRRLVEALNEFSASIGMSTDQRDQFNEKVKNIGDRHSRQREEMTLEALSNELMPDNPETLRDFLVDPDRALPDGFIPDRRSLRPLVKFEAKTATWNLEFDRQALANGDIDYQHDTGTLVISNLPEDLVQELNDQYKT